MIPPLRVLKALLYPIVTLPLPALFRCYFRRDTGSNDELRVGDCVFWGPAAFIATCQRATEDLRRLDEAAFHYLTSRGRITFWLHPDRRWPPINHYAARYYGVPEAYFRWSEQGIIAFMLYVYFLEHHSWRVFGRSTAIPRRGTSSRQSTAAWLQARHFPAELVATFTTPPEA